MPIRIIQTLKLAPRKFLEAQLALLQGVGGRTGQAQQEMQHLCPIGVETEINVCGSGDPGHGEPPARASLQLWAGVAKRRQRSTRAYFGQAIQGLDYRERAHRTMGVEAR